MVFVFKASGALILAALLGGQSWQHLPASPEFKDQVHAIGRECPALADRSQNVESKFDAITLRDAYWRGQIQDFVLGVAGERSDSCKSI